METQTAKSPKAPGTKPTDRNRRKLRAILRPLERAYGRQTWEGPGEPVEILIETILSQNTTSTNSSAGLSRLQERFPTWDDLAGAPVKAIADCIRICGLSRIKAPRIRAILRQIRAEQGKISLDFLKDRPPQEALEYLQRFRGVGPKTARCVLLFSFGTGAFPIDTHILRIAVRLGILRRAPGGGISLQKAHELLEPMIPARHCYEMHVLLITHGRRTCLARRPRCRQCRIFRFCPYGQRRLQQGYAQTVAHPAGGSHLTSHRPGQSQQGHARLGQTSSR